MDGTAYRQATAKVLKELTAPSARRVLAAEPVPLEPLDGSPRAFSFLDEIQPILDARCIRCHDGKVHEGRKVPSLTREMVYITDRHRRDKIRPTGASVSYVFLVREDRYRPAGKKLFSVLGMGGRSEVLRPYAHGAARSRFMRMMEAGHSKVKLSREEMDKLACWIDLNVPFTGSRTRPTTPAKPGFILEDGKPLNEPDKQQAEKRSGDRRARGADAG